LPFGDTQRNQKTPKRTTIEKSLYFCSSGFVGDSPFREAAVTIDAAKRFRQPVQHRRSTVTPAKSGGIT